MKTTNKKTRKRKVLIIIATILAGIILIYTILALWPRPDNYEGKNPMRKEGALPILIAHGGGNGEFPDNTLEAFYNAYSVDHRVMMETDVCLTKDGVVILSHDPTLDQKTNVTGNIADWNYSDLMAKRVNFGFNNPTDDNDRLSGNRKVFTNEKGAYVRPTDVDYPDGVEARDVNFFLATTLEELLLAFPENRINVEVKQSGELGMKCLAAVLELLEKHNAFDRVVLASFHEEMYDEFKRLKASGEVPDCFMFSPAYDAATKFYVLQLLGLDVFFGDKMCVFQLPTEEYGLNLATRSMIRKAARHNLAIHYWTVNDPDEMRELIELGADGIMTDYPHLLQEIYKEYQE